MSIFSNSDASPSITLNFRQLTIIKAALEELYAVNGTSRMDRDTLKTLSELNKEVSDEEIAKVQEIFGVSNLTLWIDSRTFIEDDEDEDEEEEESEEDRLNNPAYDREYNGHPSYRHWNACLHFGNCETLYRMNVRSRSWQDLKAECEEIGYTRTDDGVSLTDELYQAVWNTEHDDDDSCIDEDEEAGTN